LDIATISGLMFGLLVVFSAIGADGNFEQFLNVQGLIIVLGGTFSSTMMKFPIGSFFKAIPVGLKIVITNTTISPLDLINMSMELSRNARDSQRGLLSLEDNLTSINNLFFRKGIQLCVDGRDQVYIRSILNQEMDQAITRAQMSYKIFFSIAEAAPAFGMFGTLVGLIQMLSSLEDPTTVGKGLAVALLTTMYGVLIAYLFAQPIAEKLDQKSDEDSGSRELIVECVCLIQEMKNPTTMYDFLESYLPENLRHKAIVDKISK